MSDFLIMVCECGKQVHFKSIDHKYFACESCHRIHWRGQSSQPLPDESKFPLHFYERLSLGKTLTIKSKSFTIIGREQYECGNGFYNLWVCIDQEGKAGYLMEYGSEYCLLRSDFPPKDLHVFASLQGGSEFEIERRTWHTSEIDRMIKLRVEGEFGAEFKSTEQTFLIQGIDKANGVLFAFITGAHNCRLFIGDFVEQNDILF
jgi:hypothetical protein